MEISGPPQFLNNCVDEGKRDAADVQKGRHGGRKGRKDRKDLPAGEYSCLYLFVFCSC